MFHFVLVSFCLLCLAAPVGVVVEPLPAASAFMACRTWIGFDAPWEAPNVHTPHHRYHQAHILAQHA